MNTCKVLGGVACLMVLLGTGALAETMKEKPGTSGGEAAKAVQSITPQGEETITHRSLDALSIPKFEQQGEKERPLIVGEAIEKADLAQQGRDEQLYYKDVVAKASENLKEKGMKTSQKDISTQSSH